MRPAKFLTRRVRRRGNLMDLAPRGSVPGSLQPLAELSTAVSSCIQWEGHSAMSDEDRSRNEHLRQIAELCRQVEELEAADVEHARTPRAPDLETRRSGEAQEKAGGG